MWLYEYAARGARVELLIERVLPPALVACTRLLSRNLSGFCVGHGLFTWRGGYCARELSVLFPDASCCGGERSGGGWGGGRGADIVRVAPPKASPSLAELLAAVRLLPTQHRSFGCPRPVALSLRVEQLLHVEQRLPRNGAITVRHLRPANFQALRGMWAGELLLPCLPEARVEAPQEGLPAAYRHGHE